MTLDPTIASAVSAAIEKAVNAALIYDPGSRQQLSKLENRLLKIQSSQPEFSIFVSAQDKNICLQLHNAAEPDAIISGPFLKLLQLQTTPHPSLANSGVSTSGKLQVIADFQSFIQGIDIDWEAILNQFTGDILGHQIAGVARSFFSWGKENAGKFPQYFSDFLQEELRLIPTQAEVQYFAEQVDDIRAATDRLQARIEIINQNPQKKA